MGNDVKRILYLANTAEIQFRSILRFTLVSLSRRSELHEIHFTRNTSLRFLDEVCEV